MSWAELPNPIRDTAERVLTRTQLAVFVLELAGLNDRRIAFALNMSRRTVRDHLHAITGKLNRAGIHQTEDGTWTHKEAA